MLRLHPTDRLTAHSSVGSTASTIWPGRTVRLAGIVRMGRIVRARAASVLLGAVLLGGVLLPTVPSEALNRPGRERNTPPVAATTPPAMAATTAPAPASTVAAGTSGPSAPSATSSSLPPIDCRNRRLILARYERQKARALTNAARADQRSKQAEQEGKAALANALQGVIDEQEERVEIIQAAIDAVKARCR